jgi:carboxylate-amine ligase
VGRAPHHKYPTLEFRLCDACTRVDEAVCVAAIIQALVHKLWKMRLQNVHVPRLLVAPHRREQVAGDALRALGKLIDFGRQVEKPAPELIREFIEWFLGDAIDELGTRKEVEYAYRILDEGSSADRQLAVYERTGSLEAVVDRIIAETAEGVTVIPRNELRPWSRPTGRRRRDAGRGRRSSERRSAPRLDPPPSIRIGDLELGRAAPSLPQAGI